MTERTPFSEYPVEVETVRMAERWRAFADAAPSPMLVVDRTGAVRWSNRAFEADTIQQLLAYESPSPSVSSPARDFHELCQRVFLGQGRGTCELQTNVRDRWRIDVVPIGETLRPDEALVLPHRVAAADALTPVQAELLSRLSEATLAIIALVDVVEQRLLYVSPGLAQIAGFSPEELIALGADFLDHVIHPDDLNETRCYLGALRWSGERDVRELDVRVRHRGGGWRWLHVRSTPFDRDPGRSVRVVLGVAIDVTERKNVESQLAQKRALLSRIYDTSPAAIYLFDVVEQRLVYGNAQLEEVLGTSLRELLALGDNIVATFATPDDYFRKQRAIDGLRGLADGAIVEADFPMHRPDGSTRWIHCRRMVFERDRDGGVRLIVGAALDVTEQRTMQQSLAASEARLRGVMENAPDLIVQLDRDGVITIVNHADEFKPDCRPIGSSAYQFIAPCHAGVLHDALRRVFEQAQPCTCELEASFGEEASRLFDCCFGPVVVGGRVVSAIVIARDITEQRERDASIELQQAEIAHARRVATIGGMVAGVAHELNQPLYAIGNFSSACLQTLAEDRSAPAEKLRRWLARISEQAARAGELIRRLHNQVRNKAPLLASHSLTEIICGCVRLFELETQQNRIRIHSTLPESPLLVQVDRVQIEQVLVNLLRNALEAMSQCPPGERVAHVAAVQETGRVHVTVMDHGVGLSEELNDRAFEPFVSTKPNGLGLGLAISRTIIEMHGGHIWHARNHGSGVTFHFTLPMAEAPHG